MATWIGSWISYEISSLTLVLLSATLLSGSKAVEVIWTFAADFCESFPDCESETYCDCVWREETGASFACDPVLSAGHPVRSGVPGVGYHRADHDPGHLGAALQNAAGVSRPFNSKAKIRENNQSFPQVFPWKWLHKITRTCCAKVHQNTTPASDGTATLSPVAATVIMLQWKYQASINFVLPLTPKL